MAMAVFFFPNERFYWDLMIVLYCLLSGLAFGSYLVAMLYYVFGKKELQALARPALLATLSLLAAAPLPLLLHVRGWESLIYIILTPNLSSVIAVLAFTYATFLEIVFLSVWFVYRKDLIDAAVREKGLKKLWFSLLTAGACDLSQKALDFDRKVVFLLMAAGLPTALVYQFNFGQLFASFPANPWWSSALMPWIFILSAEIAGIALTILLYLVVLKIRKKAADDTVILLLSRFLFLSLILDVGLEFLRIYNLSAMDAASWTIVKELITGRLWNTYVLSQILAGSLIPAVLLAVVVFSRARGGTLRVLAGFSSLLILLQLTTLRWNVIVGGQMLSKSFSGLKGYSFHWQGLAGWPGAILFIALPFIFMYIISKVLLPDPD
ncbi:NrfD/PsrC family molybdoenzyme membrane anchor subunit [Planctomycetota bacterium]